MKIAYQPPKRKQPFFSVIKGFFRLFTPKIRVVSTDGKIPEQCLYVANHVNKMGPFQYELYFPVYTVKWGAHQMLENYKTRRSYLKNTLYIQKNKVPPFWAGCLATFEAFFSQFFYRGMKFLPTYPDARLAKTIKQSVTVLDDSALLIFPENSNDGYHEKMTNFFPGFVMVMDQYRKANGKDIPVRPVYYHKKKRLIVIGEACTLGEFPGMKRGQIAEAFKERVNGLYERIERGEFDQKRR